MRFLLNKKITTDILWPTDLNNDNFYHNSGSFNIITHCSYFLTCPNIERLSQTIVRRIGNYASNTLHSINYKSYSFLVNKSSSGDITILYYDITNNKFVTLLFRLKQFENTYYRYKTSDKIINTFVMYFMKKLIPSWNSLNFLETVQNVFDKYPPIARSIADPENEIKVLFYSPEFDGSYEEYYEDYEEEYNEEEEVTPVETPTTEGWIEATVEDNPF